jgi:hypothetical protein
MAVKLNDHHALGIIDVFAKALKRISSKELYKQQERKVDQRSSRHN